MESGIIRQETVVVQVMERIKDLITGNDYKVGDKLPTENELAEMFGAGLSSIREAIKIYNYLGILDSRPAKGAFICNAKNVSSNAIAWAVMIGKKESYDLMELRESMELYSVIQIFYRAATDAEILPNLITNLNAEIKRMKISIKMKDREEIISADYDFHKHVVETGGNSVFDSLFYFLRNFLREEIKATYFDYIDDWSLLLEEHEGLVKAFEGGDEDWVCTRISDHFKLIREKLRLSMNAG